MEQGAGVERKMWEGWYYWSRKRKATRLALAMLIVLLASSEAFRRPGCLLSLT